MIQPKDASLSKSIDLDNLKADISYLKYEISSIESVIEFIPFTQKPLDGSSIIEILLTIDSIQVKFLRIINELTSQINIDSCSVFKTVQLTDEQISELSINKICSDIVINRTKLINLLKDKDESFFKVEAIFEDNLITIDNLFQILVEQERALLKEIADLVMIYQKDRQFQRQIKQKPSL